MMEKIPEKPGKTKIMPKKTKLLTGKIIIFSINTLLRNFSGFRFLDAKNRNIKMSTLYEILPQSQGHFLAAYEIIVS